MQNIQNGVFWTKFEHSLSKTPNKEASPPPLATTRHPAPSFALVLWPPKPPFRFSLAQTGREWKQAGKNSFPPTPSLFAH